MGNLKLHRNSTSNSSLRAASIRLVLMAGLALACVAAQAQTFKVLYEFPRGADGANPAAGLVRDAAGNLYGTVAPGGNTSCYSGCGLVFSLSPAGVETVLYSFTGTNGDGEYPVAGLLRDAAGDLYGTTQNGGPTGCGILFKLDPSGNETVLYSFAGGTDGCIPNLGVIQDAEGNLYGATYSGGDSNCTVGGCGVVFKLDKAGKETILHRFHGRDGAFAGNGFLVWDAAGNLYGTTVAGGDTCPWGSLGCGVVFRVSKTGKETVLHKFTGYTDGHAPISGVLRDEAGNLYGTVSGGGDLNCNYGNGCGVIFKLDKRGKMSQLYTFKGADGAIPYAGLIQDPAGNFYGTTTQGGESGEGTAFVLRKNGKETVLHSFTGDADGYEPNGWLIRDQAGNLYGAASNGGTYGGGTVFKITP